MMTRFPDDGFPQWEQGAMTIELAPRSRWNYGGAVVLNPRGVNLHRLAGTLAGGYRAFNDPRRSPTAWHWTVGYDGHLYVHLPWWVRGVHSNGGNVWGPAVECEGFIEEPLTAAQVQTLKRLLRDFGETVGFEITRENGTLKEHREWAQTACPGDSYAPLYAALAEEDEMAAEDRSRIERLERIVAANGIPGGLKGEAALAALDEAGTSAYLSIGNLNEALRLHDEDILAIGDAVQSPTNVRAEVRAALHDAADGIGG